LCWDTVKDRWAVHNATVEARDAGTYIMEGNVILIRKADVPEYLRDSEFYKSLSEDDEELFEVPETSFKVTTTLQNDDELRNLLSTLRYWGAAKVPAFLTVDLLSRDTCVNSGLIDQFSELNEVVMLAEIGRQKTYGDKVSLAIMSGDIEVLKLLVSMQTTASNQYTQIVWPESQFFNASIAPLRCADMRHAYLCLP
jgi:hypothetical protein